MALTYTELNLTLYSNCFHYCPTVVISWYAGEGFQVFLSNLLYTQFILPSDKGESPSPQHNSAQDLQGPTKVAGKSVSFPFLSSSTEVGMAWE